MEAKLLIISKDRQDFLTKSCETMNIPVIADLIRIYGTFEEQLYIAIDVEKYLKVSNLHYEEKRGFTPNIHTVKIMVPTKMGDRPHIALTEIGLLKALMNVNSEISLKFQLYILVELKKIREIAIADLQTKYALELQRLKAEISDLKIERKMHNEENSQKIIHYLMQQVAKPVHVVLCKAPTHTEFKYELDDAFALRDVRVYTFKKVKKIIAKPAPVHVPNIDEHMRQLFGGPPVTTFRDFEPEQKAIIPKLLDKKVVGVVYIHKREKIQVLFNLLDQQAVNLKHSDGRRYSKKYAISFSKLRQIVEAHFMK